MDPPVDKDKHPGQQRPPSTDGDQDETDQGQPPGRLANESLISSPPENQEDSDMPELTLTDSDSDPDGQQFLDNFTRSRTSRSNSSHPRSSSHSSPSSFSRSRSSRHRSTRDNESGSESSFSRSRSSRQRSENSASSSTE